MEIATCQQSYLVSEIYFLIAKFLSGGPCKKTLEVLREELEKNHLLPKRHDWEGQQYDQTFDQLSKQYPHIGPDHLLAICQRICPILDREFPPGVAGVMSFLGAGRQSLLRTTGCPKQLYVSRYSARKNRLPIPDPSDFRSNHHIIRVLEGRRNSGPFTQKQATPTTLFWNLELHNRTLGHLSAVYCLLFDQTGQYVFTGADDLLVKVWSANSGRLLSTFRGASSEITDMAVNVENTLLAAGSIDKFIRVWCLQTTAPVAELSRHNGMITSVNFCPIARGDFRYLVSTSTDGSIAFWVYLHNPVGNKTVFEKNPHHYNEKMRPGQAQMICTSFSPGGTFLAAGSADHHVRIYSMTNSEGPQRIVEVEAHTDRVDSIQWANSGLRFVSGSKDGTALIWQFKRQKWSKLLLEMTTKLPGSSVTEEDNKVKPKVSMVCWDRSDKYVITAVHDATLKVWDSFSGKLVHVLKAHKDEVFVLEAHPFNADILLSAGHDGLICVWDINRGVPLMQYQNIIEMQGYGGVFDAKWSPDGTRFAASDSHGHILVFGLGSGNAKLKTLPKELFFHTDYRPLVRDDNNMILDEQTQTAPHMMPPPFLVDVDGAPYQPELQKLVPGREDCKVEQLIPNVAYGAQGEQEVFEALPSETPRSNIDSMIHALELRQFGGQSNSRQHASNSNRPGSWRNDTEGVRLSSGNWDGRGSCMTWKAKTLLREMPPSTIEQTRLRLDAIAAEEKAEFERENKIPEENPVKQEIEVLPKRKTRRRAPYRTRAAREENEFENPDNLEITASSTPSMSDSSAVSPDLGSDSNSDDDSSEYSDWIADHGAILEPPKRSKRKRVPKKLSPSPSPPPATKKKNKENKDTPEIPKDLTAIKEIPVEFQPSKWLSEVIPKKAPYYPQMGDEVMFFQQGYKYYLEAVKLKKVYKINGRQGLGKLKIPEPIFCKVVGIKYEIRPPRLCCLRLAILDESGGMTDRFFSIKYHDMPDVIDFIVLKQTYDIAIQRNWKPGDRFRCMIDDAWWEGEIVGKQPYNPAAADSAFLSYLTRWDNGDNEPMSPWDMEPPDPARPPPAPGASIPVLPEEVQAQLYCPRADDWHNGDRDATCRRILLGLNKVMEIAIAEAFIAPVDLSQYPTYAYTVEYPIDLSTIKARLENRFYRRLTAVQFDVRYLATNAEKFNEAHSQIVKHARIVTELCMKLLSARYEMDVGAVYHQIADTYHSSPSEGESDNQDPDQPGPSSRKRPESDWKVACEKLIREMWDRPDAVPFREPVDTLEHPDYLQVVECPMDLSTVREELVAGNYETIREFYKDVRLIFSNSKNYNTNQKSRIFSMTVRLSNMFEARMKQIIAQSKTAHKKKIYEKIRTIKLRRTQKDVTQPGPSKENESDTEIESEDAVGEHVKLSTLRNKMQSAAQMNGHSYAKPTNNAIFNSTTQNRRKHMLKHSESSDDQSSEESYKPNGVVKNVKTMKTRSRGKRKVPSDSSEESNESSEDSTPVVRRRRRGKRRRNDNSDNSESSMVRHTRSRKMPKKAETESEESASSEDDDDEEEEEESGSGSSESAKSEPPEYTISSRGRPRKLSYKVRALLKKD